jgi:hypothetical protein
MDESEKVESTESSQEEEIEEIVEIEVSEKLASINKRIDDIFSLLKTPSEIVEDVTSSVSDAVDVTMEKEEPKDIESKNERKRNKLIKRRFK